MLSMIDKKLFPDQIDIVQLSDGRCVYPIQKNGSSTLEKIKKRNLTYEEIKKLEIVDIFVRDPYTRFLSGVKTYSRILKINIGELCKIVNDVFFVNSHFSPQLFWIINLQRFTKCKIRINHLNLLSEYTDIIINKQNNYNHLDRYFSKNKQLKYYLELDNVLYENFLNKVVTYQDIIDCLQNNYDELYNDTFGYTKKICIALD